MKKYLITGLMLATAIQPVYSYKCDFQPGTADQIKTNLTSETGMMYCASPEIWVNSDGVGFYNCGSASTTNCYDAKLSESSDENGYYNDGVALPGFSLNTREIKIPGCNLSFWECAYYYCDGYADIGVCVDSTKWIQKSDKGYDIKYQRTCNAENFCDEHAIYQCAAGYYGTSTNGISGCTRCPSSNGTDTTSVAGSTSITSCYIPSGTTFSDTSGSGIYTSHCYYKN